LTQQKTIRKPATVEGLGLFSGQPCTLRFLPAEPDSGIVFLRDDSRTGSAPVRIPADISNLSKRARRTSLSNGSVGVETIEHVLAAVRGMDIDNVLIELSAEEAPSKEGSCLEFVQALAEAETLQQPAAKAPYVIDEPVSVSDGKAMLAALPGPTDSLDILYDLDYSSTPSIGRQVLAFRLGRDDFIGQLAPARTFLLQQEADEFRARGWGRHLTEQNIVVMGPDGPINNRLRFADEHVRHKICDLIGDLALFGRPLCGRIVAYRSGHALNHALVRKLREALAAKQRARALAGEPAMDIRKIMRLLPHRYPFLMVDRIISMEGDRRALGIKNVSINEPFFQGHWPGQPVMPGVMILEAMAQLSGILLSRRLEHAGKIAVLLSMDKVKIRRMVRPGDQLLLEAEAVRVKTRTGHCRCRAKVAEELVAEAEIRFMLVDAEPV